MAAWLTGGDRVQGWVVAGLSGLIGFGIDQGMAKSDWNKQEKAV